METPQPVAGTRLLHNLALLYIALAHSTDQDLSNIEVDAITERLRGWEELGTGTVLSAFKHAMENYTQADPEASVRDAIEVLRMQLTQPQRTYIVQDLMDIAESDGRFLFKESTFIGRVAEAWDVHTGDLRV